MGRTADGATCDVRDALPSPPPDGDASSVIHQGRGDSDETSRTLVALTVVGVSTVCPAPVSAATMSEVVRACARSGFGACDVDLVPIGARIV